MLYLLKFRQGSYTCPFSISIHSFLEIFTNSRIKQKFPDSTWQMAADLARLKQITPAPPLNTGNMYTPKKWCLKHSMNGFYTPL